MQDFETFHQGLNLHTNLSLNPNKTCDMSSELKKKSRTSLVSLFGSLLELNTGRTFWQMMELTIEAYINLFESYKEEADDHVVLIEKAKLELL